MILNVIKLNSLKKELEQERANLLVKVERLEADLNEAQNVIGKFIEEKQTFDKQIEDLKAAYEAKLADAKKELETTAESVNKKVAKELASIGIPEDAVKETISGVVTPAQALEAFNALGGAQRTEYYNKNKELILKALPS